MLDFILVPAPTQFPYGCVGCQSQAGPLVDTHRELPGFGHVYFCPRCLKTGARLYGYAKGARLDELESAAAALIERDAEIESLSRQLEAAQEGHNTVVHHDAETADELAQANARISQLEGMLRDQTDTALSLIGGTDAA